MNKRRLILSSSVILAIAFAGLIIASVTVGNNKPSVNNKSDNLKSTTSTIADKPKILTASYLVSGDVFWGRAIDLYAQRSTLKYDWPFSRLNEFKPQNYDGWVADMECPVTSISVPYQTQVDSLVFSCPPGYTASAAKYFDVFTLANNHTNNTGAKGFEDTRANLSAAGIQFFGHYDLSQKNDLCEVITIKAKIDGASAKIPVAMCGYHWLSRSPTNDELAEISNYAQYLPVWVFPHGGTEYQLSSNEAQKDLYRKMIDAGADVVFGDHPHVIQDTEAYKGKLIVYNLGNLIFDQWFDKEVTKSLIVNIKMQSTVDANVQAWLDISDKCVAFKDDCLAIAKQQGLKPISRVYTYEAIAGDSSNVTMNERLKHPATQEVANWMLERTKWTQTMQGIAKLP